MRKIRCFLKKLKASIKLLSAHEQFLLALTTVIAVSSLIRMFVVFGILIRRSHAYLNEVPRRQRGIQGPERDVDVLEQVLEKEGLPVYKEKEGN